MENAQIVSDEVKLVKLQDISSSEYFNYPYILMQTYIKLNDSFGRKIKWLITDERPNIQRNSK